MIRGEEIIQSWRTDEILIQSKIVAGLRVSKIQIKIYDFLRGYSKFLRHNINQSGIVFCENLCFFFYDILQLFLMER